MSFVDELTISAESGKGGDGVVRWKHEKSRPNAGPSGGNGGNGGDVYVIGVRDSSLLSKYRHNPEFKAEDGGDGQKDSLFGANGEDLLIKIPIGSLITNTETGAQVSVLEEDQKILMLKGGRGGRGNESYKSSTNRSPEEFTEGTLSESGKYNVEIQLIADIGLIGFPSAGKSTLLNEFANTEAKVGAYPFTTLEPNLGMMFGVVLADIPGLIEGAGEGKGLGHKFLKHIKRTKILAHLVSLEEEDPLDTYEKIRTELGIFDEELIQKEEIIILTKSDVVTPERVEEVRKIMEGTGKEVFVVSAYDDESLKTIQDGLIKKVKKV